MNFQSIIGILLITLAVVLTCFVFGGAFNEPLESVDQPFVSNSFVSNRFEDRPRRLDQLSPRIDYQPPLAAAEQTSYRSSPPIASPDALAIPSSDHSFMANLDPAPTSQVSVQADLNQTNPVGANEFQNDLINPASGNQAFERAELIPQAQLPDFNDDSDPSRLDSPMPTMSSVSQRQALTPSRDVVSKVQQKSKSALEEHFSTARSKYVQNRFVTPDRKPTLAERVIALEQRSQVWGLAEATQDESLQPPAVQRANYEAKVSGPATSVLVGEPALSGPGSVSVLDTSARSYQPEIVIESEIQPSELPRQIAPTTGIVGMPRQQQAPTRLQVNPQVEARAREHIEYGESLARRNSYLAAREEFALALLLIARSHKAHADPDAYSNRLSQGLTALDEAADFVGTNQQWSQPEVLQQKIFSHKTKLISPNEIGSLSRTKALDRYCGFAQSQIESAIGYSAAGSVALHTLGKIETRASVNNRRGDWTGQARALVFFRAAMSCDPTNAVCANDLGVLLHDMGRLSEAEQVLKVSITSSPTRSAWANLASVHSQLAVNANMVSERDRQLQLAKQAAMRAENFSYGVSGNGSVGGQWASLNEFHSNAAFPSVTTQRAPQSGQQTSNPRDASTAKSLLQKVKGWY